MIFKNVSIGSKLVLGSKSSFLPSSYRFYESSFDHGHYLQLLNKALRTELNSINTYSALIDSSKFIELYTDHKNASKTLSSLIIENGGKPEERSGVLGDISQAVLQASTHMPQWLNKQTTSTVIYRTEKSLQNQYEQLIKEAPYKDRLIIQCLRTHTNRHLIRFT